jgi:hypothetical protein
MNSQNITKNHQLCLTSKTEFTEATICPEIKEYFLCVNRELDKFTDCMGKFNTTGIYCRNKFSLRVYTKCFNVGLNQHLGL